MKDSKAFLIRGEIEMTEEDLKERYYETVVERLPGGVSVICCESDGRMKLEFVSEGLAKMMQRTVDEVKQLYKDDLLAGIHPDDRQQNQGKIMQYIEKERDADEFTIRMEQRGGSYIWVRVTLSLLELEDGNRKIYVTYMDINKSIEKKEQIRRQYEELIIEHYRKLDPNTLVVGHCNVTRNRIIDIIDYTESDLLNIFGDVREDFFRGISGFIVDKRERELFLYTYMNQHLRDAFQGNEREQIVRCFLKLPKEENGRYVQFQVNLVEDPDTGDITGILTVIDVTEKVMTEHILQRLYDISHDLVVDVDIEQDLYVILSKSHRYTVKRQGTFSEQIQYSAHYDIVPRDRESFEEALDLNYIKERLKKEESYTFAFSTKNENGDIRTKTMTVSAIDLRLNRVCLMCNDITDSIREQQGLLSIMVYTFELMAFVHVSDRRCTMYTRQVVLENLSPYIIEDYDKYIERFTDIYVSVEGAEEVEKKFSRQYMVQRLEENPAGYDFVFGCKTENGLRYKQINVLWGDQNHQTICMVRADVTDMLAEERERKEALEKALSLAEETSLAKSNFLSSMSHDIRTPMNAIMGMTTLATAHLDDRDRVKGYLEKITVASTHLLSLINDVLDMSRIEQSRVVLNEIKISLPEFSQQIFAIMDPQTKDAGLQFHISMEEVHHKDFYGDTLRISQILINLLSNAIKFTPEGGRVDFRIKEIPPLKNQNMVRYQFEIRDTGIGMPEEFLETMFDPFTRNYQTHEIEGSGLGLSIAKGLVDLMEGTITVQSQVGKGSVFFVELEFKVVEGEELGLKKDKKITMETEKKQVFEGRCFMVVEDNSINAEIICELLLIEGAHSVRKMDGLQAVKEFQDTEPGTYDAILMDIQMPNMNGYESTRAIRGLERQDAKSIPIIALTANAFVEDIKESIRAGMTAHISKPIDVHILKEILCKALNM